MEGKAGQRDRRRGGEEKKTNWNMAEVISLKRGLCGLHAKSAEIYAEGAGENERGIWRKNLQEKVQRETQDARASVRKTGWGGGKHMVEGTQRE